jgi:hypothetical protein
MGPRIDVCRRQRQKISKLCKLTGILVILGGTSGPSRDCALLGLFTAAKSLRKLWCSMLAAGC